MNIPTMFRVALGLIALSTLLFLAGFASNYWFTSARGTGFHFGLWAICTSTRCYSYGERLSATPVHAYIGRFCTIYQLISLIASVVLLGLFLYKSARQNWAKSGYSLLLSAGILGFLGSAIFVGREKSLDSTGSVNVSWSASLVIFASILQIIAAVLIILPIRKGEVEFEQA